MSLEPEYFDDCFWIKGRLEGHSSTCIIQVLVFRVGYANYLVVGILVGT